MMAMYSLRGSFWRVCLALDRASLGVSHLGRLLNTSHHHKEASMHVAFVYKDVHKDTFRIHQVLRKPSSSVCDSNHDMSLHMCSLCVPPTQGRALALAGMYTHAANHWGTPCTVGRSRLDYVCCPDCAQGTYQQVFIELGIQLMLFGLVLIHLTSGKILVAGRVAQQAVAHKGDCLYSQLPHAPLQYWV